ncbi:MAG: glycosyltransferase family 39 protein, partial [Chloroflexota bacterium]|nr:glycosyltransferase family 39 protein [Chloroflexota bacterium]
GGSVTVDKPPLGFWVQAVSAYIFGVNGFALALPQSLAGVFSIAVLYQLVRKYFGIWAGLAAALALSVTPITIATERNNTIDGLLVFVLLLGAWAFIKAAESGKTRYLLLGAFLVGLGFNIKMLQAYMVLPAFYAVYALGSRQPWWGRILQLGAATVVLLLVSFAWVAAVDLTPAENRPFIGSSENNTVLELIIGHNGLSRLGLNDRGPGGADGPRAKNSNPQPGPATGDGVTNLPQGGSNNLRQNPAPNDRQPPQEAVQACNGLSAGDACTVNLPNRDIEGTCRTIADDQLVCIPQSPNSQFASPTSQRGKNSSETGAAGVLRLFQEPLVTEASWLLVLVMLGLPVVLVIVGWDWPLNGKHISLLLWGGWLFPVMAYFSFTTGLFHRYYLIMLGPPLAALVGITFWGLAKHWKRDHASAWIVTALITGLTIIFEIYTMRNYPDYATGVTIATIVLWLAAIIVLILKPLPQLRKIGLALVLAAMLVAPLTWSALTVLNSNPNVALPTAGLGESDHTRASMMTPNQELLDGNGRAILAYTLANTNPDDYLLATTNARGAAPFILETGRPVLTFGGFTGRDDVVDLDELLTMIENGELRYILGLPQGKPDIARWMMDSCSVVDVPGFDASRGQPAQPPQVNNPAVRREGQIEVFYDCGN